MDEALREKVTAWVDSKEEQIISDIKRLVSIDSVAELDSDVKPYGQKCLDAVKEYCDIAGEHGLRCTSYDNRVIRVDMDDSNARPVIGLWNHLDVVPAGVGWTYEPYKPVVKGDFMIGRGVKDNKGPAIGSIYAAQFLKESGVELPYKIALYAGTEEEKNMSDVLWLREQPVELANRNLVLDTHFPVCYAEKGILGIYITGRNKISDKIVTLCGGESDNSVAGAAKIEIKTGHAVEIPAELPERITAEYKDGVLTIAANGLANHVAHADNGINAIYLLCSAICGQREGSEALSEIVKGELDADTMEILGAFGEYSIGYEGKGLGINCEDEISGILLATATTLKVKDGIASMGMNIRYPVSVKKDDEMVAQIEAMAAKHSCELSISSRKKSGYFPKESPIVTCLVDIYNEYTGKNEQPFSSSGAIYARMLPNAVGFGFRILPEPASPEEVIPKGHGNPHGPDEILSISHYKKQLVLLIMSLIALEKQDKDVFGL